jgi:hypothetical protein
MLSKWREGYPMGESPIAEACGVDLEAVAGAIREAGRPLHVNVLARAAVRAQLEAEAGERGYAPGEQYVEAEAVQFNGGSLVVKAVTEGSNRRQGCFKILTLLLPDGRERRMAAEVPGAPVAGPRAVTDEQVREVLREHGLAVRNVLQKAMEDDARFEWFEDAQGDWWCTVDLLPTVSRTDLAAVEGLLGGGLDGGELRPVPTEQLVSALWRQENDGGGAYLLAEFALNVALQRCADARWVGEGWVLECDWQALQLRPVLVGPRQPNIVTPPSDVQVEEEGDTVEEEAGEEPGEAEAPTAVADDLGAWLANRLSNAVITLAARYYYGNWLPLNAAMSRVFPPRASGADGVVFFHRFGGEEECFDSWVDWEHGRILASPRMHEAFHAHDIYPGAKLVISHRDNLKEYDIRTRPLSGEKRVRVRRVFLSEDGSLEYEEAEEPLRYEVDGEVFIADARWESLEALFRQAEEAGVGIFALMYHKCCEWRDQPGRMPLYVTAQELFEAIHYDDEGRLTSKATIAWELWKRLAFKPEGAGRFLFRPEKVDRVRSLGPAPRRARATRPTGAHRIRRDSRLTDSRPTARGERGVQGPWAELQRDEAKRTALQHAVQVHLEDPVRERVLFLRSVAHRRIRKLLDRDRLDGLTLDEFNRQIWQVGTLEYGALTERIDSEKAQAVLGSMSADELREAYESGELRMSGNLTWGSSNSVIGPSMNTPPAEMEQVVRDTLRFLLYSSDGSIEERMARVIGESNGFGMNVVTGILHALYPEEHVLYNGRSVAALAVLGVPWPSNWRHSVESYVEYRGFCRGLRDSLGLESLTDVDWFMYQLGTGEIPFAASEPGSISELWDRYVWCLDPSQYIGWTVVHQRKLKGYYDMWATYLQYIDEHPGVEDGTAESATGIHWRGTMHARYLGLLTEDRVVTAAGREFYGRPDARDNILHRQLQKWYYWVDLFYREADSGGYGVYPLFAVLTVLLGLPESQHSISRDELRFFVLPTKGLGECDDRIALIRDFRGARESWQSRLDALFRWTYVGRVDHLLELSPHLDIAAESIGLRPGSVGEVGNLVARYTELKKQGLVPHYGAAPQLYLEMLRSGDSILDFCERRA